MDKKKYNQMGFDFGDVDPSQESPAAGFRIKSIKPASKEDAGESEQDTDDQENFTAQSGGNRLRVAAEPAQNIPAPSGMVFELDPEKQRSESNPNNDSEVISNTPVTSETEAHHQTDAAADNSNEEEHHAEIPAEPISAEQITEAPEAEEEKAVEEVMEEEKVEEEKKENPEQKHFEAQTEQPKVVAQAASTPNIPSKLTRPTQVYAVEEKETTVEKKNTDIGFTPASQQAGKASSDNTSESSTAEEKAANAEQLPVAANAETSEQPVAAKETVAETSPEQTESVAEQPAAQIEEQPAAQQQAQTVVQNTNVVKEEEQPVVEQNTVAAKTEEQPAAQKINAVKEEEQPDVEQNAVAAKVKEQPVAQTQEQTSAPVTGNNEIPAQTTTPVQANPEQNIKAETALQPEAPANTGVVARPKATAAAQPSVVAEPEQVYQNNQTQDQSSKDAVEEEDFNADEPHVGVNFNTPAPELPKKSTRGRKSLKTLDAEASAMNIPEDATLFKRQYYSIGEVAGMFGVNQSLLRFWENEFDIIQPRKNRKGDRHFRPLDIKNLETDLRSAQKTQTNHRRRQRIPQKE